MLFAVIDSLDDTERELTERIYLEYGKKIYAVALGIVKNHHDAEDVLEKVMINVMENIEKFSDSKRADIAAQIVIYSRNEAINLYNRKKRQNAREIQTSNEAVTEEEDDMPDCEIGVEDSVINEETRQIIKHCLLRLTKDYSDVIRLVYQLGYSYEEAGKIMHISPNAVGIKLFRAKKKLIKLSGGELLERLQR